MTPSEFRSAFESRTYTPDGDPKATLLLNFEIKSNSAVYQDFSPVFLAHARLYTFADMRLVEPLKNLALHKLHKTLLGFKLYRSRVGDVIALVRYAYDNGKDREDNGTIDELRRLVVDYIVCEISMFRKHKNFIQILEEGGEFVSDFWKTCVRAGVVA